MKNVTLRTSSFQSIFLAVVYILFSPSESRADAIMPLINLFTPDTAISASIFIVLIIFIETLLLWIFIKPISFRLSLWRATIINIISSAAGSIFAWLFFKERIIWGMMELYISMFFLTLATETPALRYLYRQNDVDWKRSIKVSISINFISYIFVFIAQFGLIFAYFWYADFADTQALKKWNDLSLLEGESGYIYTVKHAPTENSETYIFNRYNVENKKWETVASEFERGIYPTVWDVKGNLIACIIETGDWKNRPITVINATTFSKLSEINGNFIAVRISPDLNKLAALEYVGEINAPRDDESAFMLDSGCKLKIYDIESGTLLYEASRLALNEGLDWIGNSTIIFSSLRDELLLQNSGTKTYVHTYGRSYAKPGQFPIDLFVYDLGTNSIRRLIEGQAPQFIPSKNEVSFFREHGFNHDLWQINLEQINPRLILRDIGENEIAVSPNGRKFLILVPHRLPLSSSYFLTIVDPNDHDRKLIIDPNFYNYGFRWIKKE